MNHLSALTICLCVALSGLLSKACSHTAEQECEADSDCPSGRYCAGGSCIFDCTINKDCPEGLHCNTRGHCDSGCVPTNNGQELCDGLDNDCDGQTDEDWSQLGKACYNDGCAEGVWVCSQDKNSMECDGPTPAEDDSECDGVDNDCDGYTDEDAMEQPCPLQEGVCQGAMMHCEGKTEYGQCDYGAEYTQELDASCDQKDNDCDGYTDEDASPVLQPESGQQSHDGLDNNCNGLVDEVGGVMVPHPTIPNLWIDSYETVISATEDCSGEFYGQSSDDYPQTWGPGITDGEIELYACSLPGVIPSGWLSWYRARRACEAQGKKLCEPGEWSIACNRATSDIYPYGMVFIEGICNDAWHSLTSGQQRLLPTGTMKDCTSAGLLFDASGNLAEWVNEWSEDDPNRAVFAGFSYKCELCHFDDPCLACDIDSDGDYSDVKKDLSCRVHEGKIENCAYPDQVRSYFGVRCCYSR